MPSSGLSSGGRHPFCYLLMSEDVLKADCEVREKSLEELYFGRARKDMLNVQLLQMAQKKSPGCGAGSWS